MGGAPSSTVGTISDSGEVLLTKEEVVKLVGEKFDEQKWEALEKDLFGRVAFSDIVDACRVINPLWEATLVRQREKIQWLAKVQAPGFTGALGGAPKRLLSDRDIILSAIEKNPRALEYASEELRASRDIVFAAASAAASCLSFASKTVMEDEEFLMEVRAALAAQHRGLAPEIRERMEYALNGIDGFRYTGALNAALDSGDVLLLRASYVISLAQSGGVLCGRDELPPEAFYHGPIWEGPGGRGVLVVAFSYMHHTATHHDPDGLHLKDVARFLRFLKRSRDGYEVVMYWDAASSFLQRPGKPMLESQRPLSEAARNSVAFWYTHPNVLVVQSKITPAGREKGWNMSAWPLFEECLCLLLKPQSQLMDLQTFKSWISDEDVEEWRKSDYHQLVANCASVPGILPLAPMSFKQQIGDGSNKNDRHLPGGLDDAEVLRAQYNSTIQRVAKDVVVLRLNAKGRTSSEWYNPLVIAGVRVGFISSFLELCTGLRELDLSRNKELVIDIANVLRKCPVTLEILKLANTGSFGDGAKASWTKVPALKVLDLQGTQVKGTRLALEAALIEASGEEHGGFQGGLKIGQRGGDGFGIPKTKCQIWAGLDAEEFNFQQSLMKDDEWQHFIYKVMPLCQKLETLVLSDNNELNTDIELFVAKLPETLKRLYLSNTAIFGSGLEAPWGRLKGLNVLDLRGTDVSGSMEEFHTVLAAGKKCSLVL